MNEEMYLKEAEETILVMTPRCDINKPTCEQILACKIIPLEIKLTKKEKFQQAKLSARHVLK